MVKRLVGADSVTGEFDGVVEQHLKEVFAEDVGALSAIIRGVVQNPAVGSAATVQALHDEIRAEIVSSSFVRQKTLTIPGGRYRIDEQIVWHPSVKLVVHGTAVFETYVPGEAAIWVTPDASDATDPTTGVLQKQQWNWGTIIDAVGGALIFVNRTGTRAGTIGIETGSRTNLTTLRPLSRYEIANVGFQDYGLGMKWNAFNHYICTYRRWHMELCDKFVHYGAGVNVVNSGEKVTFIDSLFGVNTAGNAGHTIDCDTVNVQFFNCSHDYLSTLLHFTAAAGYQRVDFFGGHIENINEGIRRVADGGIVRSDVVSPRIFPEVVLHGVPFVSTERGVQFRGNVIVRADMDYRQVQTGTIPFANAYLCDDTVQPRNWRMRGFEQRVLSSRKFNTCPDGSFKTEVDGTAHSALTKWTTDVVGSFTGVVANTGPRTGDKSIDFTIGAGGFWRFYAKPKVRVQPGARITASLAYRVPAAPAISLQARAVFEDNDGNVLETTANTTFTIVIGYGAWNVPSAPLGFTAPEGAAFCRVQFSVSAASATAGAISDVHVSVEMP